VTILEIRSEKTGCTLFTKNSRICYGVDIIFKIFRFNSLKLCNKPEVVYKLDETNKTKDHCFHTKLVL